MNAPAVGDVLAGKYRIERILGEGGMGLVVVARHLVLDELVAIKFLLPQYANNAEVVARFIREAKAAIRIQSEHVVRVSDVAQFDSGAPYMVMELLDGCDLARLLEQRGPLSVDDATTYVLQACEALAQAHVLGIVHRDLKPPNLFLTRLRDGTPCLKVLDFGISKFIGSADAIGAAMTKTGGTMGSILYMPPEQLESAKHVDARTDIWALGVILYELLAGTTPFVGEHIGQIVRQIMEGRPRPLREVRPDVPPALEAVVHRCLEKQRELRFASVADFALALSPVVPRHARSSIDRIVRFSMPAGTSSEAPVSSTTPKFERPSGQVPIARASAENRTNGNWGTTGPGASASPAGVPKRGSSLVVVAALVALVALGGAAFGLRAYLSSRSNGTIVHDVDGVKSSEVAPASPTTDDEPAASTSSEPTTPSPTAQPAVVASTTTHASQTSGLAPSKPPVVAATSKPPAATTKPSSAPSTKTSAPPAATIDCNPPYTLDSDGIKHHKPGCQ